MSFKDDVNVKFDALTAKIETKSAEFIEELAELKEALDEALSREAVSAEDKAEIMAKFDAVVASFEGKFDVDPAKPVPPPVEPPVGPPAEPVA